MNVYPLSSDVVEAKVLRHRQARGITMLEMLVILGVIGIAAAIIAPNFLRLAKRARIEGAAQEVTSMLSQARAEAISRGVPVVVYPDVRGEEHWLVAWADVDRDDLFGGTEDATGTLEADASAPAKSVDYVVFQRQLPFKVRGGALYKDGSVYFWGAPDNAPATAAASALEGFAMTDIPTAKLDDEKSWGNWKRGVVFNPDGTAEETGSIRIAAGPHGGDLDQINYLEMRIQSKASGRVELRKYVVGAVGCDMVSAPEKCYLAKRGKEKWVWY